MSRIPDGRTDEYYNQKYLKPIDAEFLRGFDWATEMAVDNFFANEMFGLADEESYIGHFLCEKLPENMQEKYEMEYTFGDVKSEERTVKTYADLIRMKLLEWIEMGRNELITGMIDGMDEDEYKKIRQSTDGN